MPDTSLGRRSIGEILLEHGYVTKEQVDEATAVQTESGRPLGQILVEAGTITRLELASALAEQWSDSGAPISPPDGLSLSGSVPTFQPFERPAAPALPAAPDPELLARLDAVEEALQRLADAEGEDDGAELRAALDSVAERLGSAEPAIAELDRRLEQLASDDGRDGPLQEVLAVVAELQERVASIAHSTDTAHQQSEVVATEAAAAVERTGQELRDELAALSARLSTLARGEEVERLSAVVDALSQRPVRDPDLVAQIEDLQAVVEALGDRPARDPDLVAQIEDLQAVVEALSQRPTRDVELGTQVDTLAMRLAEIGDRVDVLHSSVQGLAGDSDELHQLQGALAELAQRPLADPASERRLDELAGMLEELATRPVADPAAEQRVEQLAAAVDQLAQRPVADPVVEERVERLADAVDELAQRPTADPAAEQRMDELAATLDELRASTEALASRPAGDPDLDEKLFAVTARLAELEHGDVLRDLQERVAELIERPSVDPSLLQRLAELETKVDRLPGDEVLEKVEAGERSLGYRIDGVVARIDEVTVALEQVGSSDVQREAWDEAIAIVNSRIDVERELADRLSAVEERIAQVAAGGVSSNGAPVTDPQIAQQLAALSARVEQLAAGVAVAPSGEDGDLPVSTATPATLERDVEHVLMAIERLSVHLGAHERALTDLMGSSGVVAQLRELTARVTDLETYGGGGGSTGAGGGDGEMRAELRGLMRRLEEAETSQKQDRERVIEQLEKAAGAIDWRLQRLESVKTDEPTS